MHATLEDWIAKESLAFSIDARDSLNAAVDTVVASLGDSLELLGIGEPLHGGGEFLVLRNRIFHRLVEAHGYTAIAIESSFPRAHAVSQYVTGGGATYDAVAESGFSHGFGRLDGNRELIEWMRLYNADPTHQVKLSFYGFDSPTEMTGTDSPRQLLEFALAYLASIDRAAGDARRERIAPLLGEDFDWENPAAMMDPAKSIGLSAAATALRIETEDLITELRLRRPELVASGGQSRYLEAAQYASVARELLNYHALLARQSPNRTAELLGIRDAMMADNLAYTVAHQHGRGKVLAFAHNSHLQRGQARWQLGPHALAWWPAGSHLNEMFGSHYAVIGAALGACEANGIANPEPGTLEALLAAAGSEACFVPTHQGRSLPAGAISNLPTRSGSSKNSSDFPLTAKSLSDFDWLVTVNGTARRTSFPR